MVRLIGALLLFAGSIVAALLQSAGVSAALAIAAVAVAVFGELPSPRDRGSRKERGAQTPDDDPRAANSER